MRQSMEVGILTHLSTGKMDLGFRGPCRVLLTPLRRQLEEFVHFLREGVPTLRCAMPGSTGDMCYASAPGCFRTYFLREGGTRILKSILSCSPEEMAALVVDNGSGMCLLVCWLRYSSCCVSFDCRQAWGMEKCAQLMLQLRYLYLTVSCSPTGRCRRRVFFAPPMAHTCELSRVWVTGTPGVHSRVFCHPN